MWKAENGEPMGLAVPCRRTRAVDDGGGRVF